MNPYPRVRVNRLKPPVLLRLPVLLFVFAAGFALYDATGFYFPLWLQQNVPQGAGEGIADWADQMNDEYQLEQQTWAMPIRDFLRSAGQCVRRAPASPKDELPPFSAEGENLAFAKEVKSPPADKFETVLSCRADNLNLFTVGMAPGSEAVLHRLPNHPLGIELADGSLRVQAEPGADFRLILPNGRLQLHTNRGFRGTISRDEELLKLNVTEGDLSALPAIAMLYREASPAWQIHAGEKAQVDLGGQAKVAAGRAVRILPSGVYEVP